MITKHYGTSQLKSEFGEMSFGKALESYRLGEGLSQKEFASQLKISAQSLCDLERGRRIPSPSRAAKVAKKIGEPEAYWVQLALQDFLKKEKVKLVVKVA